jgi:homoserine O-succinyltransferase
MIARPLRVGIVNLMPKAESYEPYLLRPLLSTSIPVEAVWLRLSSHSYSSSDPGRIAARYVLFEHALRRAPLHGLIISGAPVEELDFEEVVYWRELRELLSYARSEVTSTLGLCWGALALGAILGLEKHRFENKLFGVFENRRLLGGGPLGDSSGTFLCAHSRHSGIADATLEAARDAGTLRLLAHGRDTGYSIFESADRRLVAHLGHPEYEASRLAFEWERDRALRRRDVKAPVGVDLEQPRTTWHAHRTELFGSWLRFIAAQTAVQASACTGT